MKYDVIENDVLNVQVQIAFERNKYNANEYEQLVQNITDNPPFELIEEDVDEFNRIAIISVDASYFDDIFEIDDWFFDFTQRNEK